MAFLFVFGVLNEREKKLMSVWDRGTEFREGTPAKLLVE